MFEMLATQLLSKNGVVVLFGILIFIIAYKNSILLFKWVEEQTFGTRDYIIEKLDLMFIEIDPGKITMVLIGISFGSGSLALAVLGVAGHWGVGVALGIILGFVGWKLPKPVVNYLVTLRTKKYQGQMVDGLQLLANGIRAGLSLPQCLAMVVDELPAPISQEFNLILQQNKIGVPLEECFDSLLKRVHTQDNEMFVTSINILRETGGNLAETFDTIVTVIRERIKVQQKIDTYIAQGKIQGIVIFCMPFGMGIVYSISDPESMIRVVSHPIGIAILFMALVLNCLGGFVIHKMIQIDV